MELTGQIIYIGETGTYGASGFRKRILGLEIPGQYAQKIGVELTQDKCDLLNNYRVGQMVKVSTNLRGNMVEKEFEEPKFFNSLQAWKIEQA